MRATAFDASERGQDGRRPARRTAALAAKAATRTARPRRAQHHATAQHGRCPVALRIALTAGPDGRGDWEWLGRPLDGSTIWPATD